MYKNIDYKSLVYTGKKNFALAVKVKEKLVFQFSVDFSMFLIKESNSDQCSKCNAYICI